MKVRAPNDAHIALTGGPNETHPIIEAIIGGWQNTKSVIRKNKSEVNKVECDTPDILSLAEYRVFWIRVTEAAVKIGRAGEAVPFLSWQDPEPFVVQSIGVCTGGGASGNWIIGKS